MTKKILLSLIIWGMVQIAFAAIENQVPSDSELKTLHDKEASIPQNMQELFYCVCAVGFASSGDFQKANSYAKKLTVKNPKSIFIPILNSGALVLPCPECSGICFETPCLKCDGKGVNEIMVGTKGKCITCAGNGFIRTPCKACNGRPSSVPSKDACAFVYNTLKNDLDHKLNPDDLSVRYVMVVLNIIKTRMTNACMLYGRVGTANDAGYFMLVSRKTTKGKSSDINNEEVYIYDKDGVALTDKNHVSVCYYVDTVTALAKDGSTKRIMGYSTDPWYFESTTKKASSSSGVENKYGVPQNVFDRIRGKAEGDWPGDFRMQLFAIETQVKAWKELNSK